MILSPTFSPVPETDFAAQQGSTHTTSAVVRNCTRHSNILTHHLVLLLIKFQNEWNLSIPSEIVPAPHVSVRPKPWPTGQQKQTFINRWVAADSGAPPDNISLTRPPRIFLTFRNKLSRHIFNKFNCGCSKNISWSLIKKASWLLTHCR